MNNFLLKTIDFESIQSSKILVNVINRIYS